MTTDTILLILQTKGFGGLVINGNNYTTDQLQSIAIVAKQYSKSLTIKLNNKTAHELQLIGMSGDNNLTFELL